MLSGPDDPDATCALLKLDYTLLVHSIFLFLKKVNEYIILV